MLGPKQVYPGQPIFNLLSLVDLEGTLESWVWHINWMGLTIYRQRIQYSFPHNTLKFS